jgi:hypothetical protein
MSQAKIRTERKNKRKENATPHLLANGFGVSNNPPFLLIETPTKPQPSFEGLN